MSVVRGTLLPFACAIVGVLVAFAPPSLAARGHKFASSFGAPCSATPCGTGQLKEPSGIAINESTGNVYVVDKGDSRVEYFSASGTYRGQFNGSGAGLNEGKLAGSGGLPNELATGEFSAPGAVAIDNVCALHKPQLTESTTPSCASLDPSNGDVYVADRGHNVVDKFTASGEYVGQITATPAGSFAPLYAVAVDSAGKVWTFETTAGGSTVADSFSSTLVNQYVTSSKALSGLGLPEAGFAVDSDNNLYPVLNFLFKGTNVVAKFNSSGEPLNPALARDSGTVPYGSEVLQVAIELSTNEAYVSDSQTVTRLASDGTEVEAFKAATVRAGGIGVNARTETIYVADVTADLVDIFGPAPPSAPTVESEAVSKVTAESAQLHADINPRGAPTEYAFEYGACSTPTTCPTSAYHVGPSVSLGGDFAVHAVVEELYGQAHTVYHYRVAAHNDNGSVVGPEHTFMTQTSGSGFALPDNRAWELVSPPSKHGAAIEPINEQGIIQAAASGDAITYNTNGSTAAEPQGNANNVQVLSKRGATGWESYDLAIPHQSATGHFAGEGYEYRYFSTDLSLAAVQPFGAFEPSLSSEASVQTAYLRQTECAASCYRPLVTSQPGHANVPPSTEFGAEGPCAAGSICGPEFVGGTPDLSHVVLESSVGLTAGTSGGLYEWANGQLTFVGAKGNARPFYAISNDGSRVVFNGVFEGQSGVLLMRDVVKGQTIRLDSPEKGVNPSGNVAPRFQFASADGSTVYFTDEQRLTSDSGATEGAPDLYECHIVEEAGTELCDLTDVTPLHESEPADVVGVSGASEDGARIYFVANGVQGSAAGAKPGSCSHLTSPAGATCNLYTAEAGHTELIAVLSGADRPDWQGLAASSSERDRTGITARVSPNGQWFAFMSERPLTGYENRDAANGRPDEEVYLFHTTSGVACASCNPTGARPTGVEYSKISTSNNGLAGGDKQWQSQQWLAASVPGWTPYRLGVSLYQSRYLSDSGRLFFNSSDALVPQDVNGTQDVYEYEPQGVGTCSESSPTFGTSSEGCVGLISSGGSAEESAFVDASETGSDVFFLTSAKLVAQDTDTSLDLYDAHECTTSSPCLASPAAANEEPCNSSTSCAGPVSAQSALGAPASTLMTGAGNLAPVPVTITKPHVLTPAQKLSKALKACKRKANKHKREACEKQARRTYRPARSTKTTRKRSK